MTAVDPTYPLYPTACFISSSLLLLILITTPTRQSWNPGVAFLCFWVCLGNFLYGINATIWAENADIKLHAFCDISTRMQPMISVVGPMSTLIIVRRLSLIADLQSAELPMKISRRLNVLLEWFLGFGVPVLIVGPLWYVTQACRFRVFEGFGCQTCEVRSVLTILLEDSWGIVLPLLSLTVYCPKVTRTFYRHRKDVIRFLRNDNSISATIYSRILLLAVIDLCITLPINLTSLALSLSDTIPDGVPFWPGWRAVHDGWDPLRVSYAEVKARGALNLALFYFSFWIEPILGFIIFGLFGLTSEARRSYWQVIFAVRGWLGWKPSTNTPTHSSRSALSTIKFSEQTQDSTLDAEMGYTRSFVLEGHIRTLLDRSNPSFVNHDLVGPAVVPSGAENDKPL